MNSLAVAVLVVAAVAHASAGGIIAPGLGLVSSRGALEGALGGQWIPDVPVAHQSAVLAAPAIASPLAYAAPSLVAGHLAVAAPVPSKGAVEGALGGQWIPDVPEAHSAVLAAPAISSPLAYAAPALAAGHLSVAAPILSKGAVEGALGGQWIPDVLGK